MSFDAVSVLISLFLLCLLKVVNIRLEGKASMSGRAESGAKQISIRISIRITKKLDILYYEKYNGSWMWRGACL